jgi:amino acid adenylation domain-containing protein
MTLLAAFYALLYRYSGQSDIVVGSPVAGRDRAEIEGLVGFFVNTLALRVQVEGGESFRELLRRVREVCLGAYGHQGVPFERLVEEVASGREMSHTPLFQVVFALQNVPRGEAELGGVSLRMEAADNQTSKFDLVLMMEESEQGLYGSLEYNTDLFEAATIERMLRHFKMLLSGIASNAEQPVAALPMLTEAERNYLLSEWNATESHYPREKSINRLFEERAAQMPGAVALVSEDEQVSYEELNRRANQLARYLRRLGVSAEVPVGICVERGVELIVGLLAILKAGGAYVPLDPYFPQQRLSFMLKDSGAAVLLTQESLLDRLPECSARRFCLDADWGLSAQESEEDLVGGAGAENLAYIIYTSGSTGNPKGACITHRAVNRLVINTDYVDLRPSDKVAQASNASFDAATFEIWGALLSGAQLIMIKRETALSPQAFAAQLKNDGITVLFLTTALFNQIVRERPEAFATLRHLFFGGERVDTHSVRLMLKGGAPEHLRHVYGPTETTTFATSYPIRHVPDGANTIPIGRPIANTQVYILDRGLEPVASGVAGELYIGGDGLQRCYLNQAELTAEKLIPNPFGDAAGSRLYKTGDLARHLPDGEIEFLGRLDNQVKLRGFRVELGEIESALSNHPFVRENVVVLREDGSGDKRLVAYVAPQPESSLTAMQLRSYLKGQLPDYMIPSSFTLLDRLPLNANGKVDRRALPEPDEQRPQVAAEYVGARTVVEEVLAGLWAEVLGVKEVGVNDNFFELGGHSLMATQLVSKLRNTFHIELPLRLLFESPNVAELAQTLIKHEAKPGLTEKIALAVKKIKSMSPEDKQETLKRLRESKG